MKLDENGEILVRGPNVFPGYWGKEPQGDLYPAASEAASEAASDAAHLATYRLESAAGAEDRQHPGGLGRQVALPTDQENADEPDRGDGDPGRRARVPRLHSREQYRRGSGPARLPSGK